MCVNNILMCNKACDSHNDLLGHEKFRGPEKIKSLSQSISFGLFNRFLQFKQEICKDFTYIEIIFKFQHLAQVAVLKMMMYHPGRKFRKIRRVVLIFALGTSINLPSVDVKQKLPNRKCLELWHYENAQEMINL